MNRESYQTAFSWLEPSLSTVEQAMAAGSAQKKTRRPVRLGAVLVAAALAVLVLSGAVFAVTQHWFTLDNADRIAEPIRTDPEAIGTRSPYEPEPQGVLDFSMAKSATCIGFCLPDSYNADKASLECRMLSEDLYQRYYRASDLKDPNCPRLTIQILDNGRTDFQTYFTRHQTKIIKQETLNGMDTVWLEIVVSYPELEYTEYCLFQKNESLGCIAAITSTVSFAEAEQAAADLTFVDSGIPVTPEEDVVYYGMRLGWTPDDMFLDHHNSLAEDWLAVNAVLQDPDQDLSEAWTSAHFFYDDEQTSCGIGVSIEENRERFSNPAPIEYGKVYQTGTFCGHEARWVQGKNGSTYILVLIPELKVELKICVTCTRLNPENGIKESVVPDESWVEKAEKILASVEIIPVPIAEKAPVEYMPFAVG